MGRALLPSLVLPLLIVATTIAGDARTWSWTYTSHGVNGAGVASASVTLGSSEVATSNRIPVSGHPDVVYSCSVKLSDVARAIAVSTGAPSLLIQLRAGHAANCQLLGSAQGIVLPADDRATIASVASAINDACCGAALRTPAPVAAAPSAAAPRTAHPARTAAARPAPEKPRVVAENDGLVMSVADWVETDGLFFFVRVQNEGSKPVTVTHEEISGCIGIQLGCVDANRRFVIDRGGVATVATVAASNTSSAAFTYRYTAMMPPYSYAGSGSSSKHPPNDAPRISAEQIRVAEASLLGTLAGEPPPQAATTQAPPAQNPTTPARLVRIGAPEAPVNASGTIQLRVLVDPNGSPEDASILSISNDALADAAMEAAVTSTYAPARRNGKPVSSQLIVNLQFDQGRLSAR